MSINSNSKIYERKIPPDTITIFNIPYSRKIVIDCDKLEEKLAGLGKFNIGYIPTCCCEEHEPFKTLLRKSVKSNIYIFLKIYL
ncbi:MAG: hypothetical protein ACFFA7_05530 [Promethearchaeota archaeon]